MKSEDLISKTFGKDYFISILGNRVVITQNPNAKLVNYDDMMDVTKRYLYKEGDKILTPFGIQTIKEIIYRSPDHHGYELLIMVEENGNQYKPCELLGIFIKEMTLKEWENILAGWTVS